MKSPVANHQEMEKVTLEKDLLAYQCPESQGVYITLKDYWEWHKKQPARLEHLPQTSEISPQAIEPNIAKICPESRTIMTRYRVGHGFNFSIDRSITGGVWLDTGEWEALRARNFHDEIHLVFTAPWQDAVLEKEAAKIHLKMLEARLGNELLTELTELRKTLDTHPHKNLALAYLNQMK